ncbi:MAG: ABC transporter permease [Saprospiraceae bacterium]|nr:ABC transporter permease [Saprospiraceae bacterium]MBP7802832.1 ABC transporter permease [Saprospiraceae bacterium]MBP8094643.1 ABC transporter permease [Saprospiraceae bacterium]
MNTAWHALKAEVLKNKHSPIHGITLVAFALAPIFGGIIMFLMQSRGMDGLSGALRSKSEVLAIAADWPSYLSILTQAVGVGGILIFGFITSWLFGREFSDGTVKDLIALPVSRANILNAKFIYATTWCVALVICNLLIGLLIGFILGLSGWEWSFFARELNHYFLTTFLIILLNTPVAYFALWGKGYLSPLGLVTIMLVLSQILGALGVGQYFPWAVPGLYSGSGGTAYRSHLNYMSYALLFLTSIAGYFGSIRYWSKTDLEK